MQWHINKKLGGWEDEKIRRCEVEMILNLEKTTKFKVVITNDSEYGGYIVDVFLNSIYKGRYPTEEGLLPHGEPSREDTEQAISATKKLIEKLSNIQTAE